MCKSILVQSINNNIILCHNDLYSPGSQHECIHRFCKTLVLISIRRVRLIWAPGIHSCTSSLIYKPVWPWAIFVTSLIHCLPCTHSVKMRGEKWPVYSLLQTVIQLCVWAAWSQQNSLHASLLVALTLYLVAQIGQFLATNVIISEHRWGGRDSSNIYVTVSYRSNFKHTENNEV